MTIIMSETINEIAAALSQAQEKVEVAIKNQKNSHFRNSYADLSSILKVAKPALADYGLALLSAPGYDAENRVATMSVILTVASSDEFIRFDAAIPIQKLDAHGVASGWTYLRRYCVSAVLNISVDEDDDGNLAADTTGRPTATKKSRQQQVVTAKKAIKEKKKVTDKEKAAMLEKQLAELKKLVAAAEKHGSVDAKAIDSAKKVLEKKGTNSEKKGPLRLTTDAILYLQDKIKEAG